MQQQPPSQETQALLSRLATRPGVQSTLVLSRDSGAIVSSSGLLTAEDVSNGDGAAATATDAESGSGSPSAQRKKGTRNAEDVARLVYGFVRGAGAMIEELNGEGDEAKLLRLRTRKNEIVVVPDAKFLLVVVHDTPPA